MPDFPIVDSHVHLYDVARLSYGWLAGVPAIARTYLIEDFDEARGRIEVDAIVFRRSRCRSRAASAGSADGSRTWPIATAA